MKHTLVFSLIFVVMAALQPASIHQPALNLPPNYELISVDNQGNLHGGGNPAISADGYFVAFISTDANLVAGDTNGKTDIFLRDRKAKTTTRLSADSSGNQANDGSFNPSITGDGRYVVFNSNATNLIAGDMNNQPDVFLHDMLAHTTTRISVDNNGNQGNDASYNPKISEDGRFVVFGSMASNLVPGDTNNAEDIFLYTIQTHSIRRVSVDSSGNQANSDSSTPAISWDGRYVAFDSNATNLVEGDTNAYTDVFLFDTQTGQTVRVSVDNAGNQGNNSAGGTEISGDGRYVGFRSYATNLVPNDNNNGEDIFVFDTLSHTTRIWGPAFNGYYTGDFSLSYNGRYLAFGSFTPNPMDAYRDIWTWSWEIVSYQGENAYGGVSLSGDGHLLAYAQDVYPVGGPIVFVRSLPLDPCPQSSPDTCTYMPFLAR